MSHTHNRTMNANTTTTQVIRELTEYVLASVYAFVVRWLGFVCWCLAAQDSGHNDDDDDNSGGDWRALCMHNEIVSLCAHWNWIASRSSTQNAPEILRAVFRIATTTMDEIIFACKPDELVFRCLSVTVDLVDGSWHRHRSWIPSCI